MRIENIIKQLRREGFNVVVGEFAFQKVYMCEGTALIDLCEGKVKGTSAKYSDVVEQVRGQRSHIWTIENKKRELTRNYKIGYKDV